MDCLDYSILTPYVETKGVREKDTEEK
jgi:hypothetical protein